MASHGEGGAGCGVTVTPVLLKGKKLEFLILVRGRNKRWLSS
jgi:hypothetical protein